MVKYDTVLVISYIVKNARWNSSVLSLDIAANLPCASLNLHPKVAVHSLFNMQEIKAAFSKRYCSVSHCIYYAEIQYSGRLICKECALKHECFIPWYRSDPAMYCTFSFTQK